MRSVLPAAIVTLSMMAPLDVPSVMVVWSEPLVVVHGEPGLKVQLLEGVIAPAPWKVKELVGEKIH
jgi:hypothetical protein